VGSYSANPARDGAFIGERRGQSAIIHLPVAFALIADLEKPIFWVVPLLAVGAFQIAAPGGSLAIVVFSDRESRPAAAGNHKHLERLVVAGGHFASIQRTPRGQNRVLF